jgi:hypothetical protein
VANRNSQSYALNRKTISESVNNNGVALPRADRYVAASRARTFGDFIAPYIEGCQLELVAAELA